MTKKPAEKRPDVGRKGFQEPPTAGKQRSPEAPAPPPQPAEPDYSRLPLADLQALRAHVVSRLQAIDARLAALGAPPVEVVDVDRITLARLIGIRPDGISEYTREGMPVLAAGRRGIAARYDAVAALAWWRRRKQGSAEMERMRRDRSIADLNEIKKAEQERRLVPRDQVIREGHSYSATVRDRVRALPRRFLLAGILHTEHQGEGERICDEILDELVAWAEGLAKP